MYIYRCIEVQASHNVYNMFSQTKPVLLIKRYHSHIAEPEEIAGSELRLNKYVITGIEYCNADYKHIYV